MKNILNYELACDAGVDGVGGKAWNMARMARWGFVVPIGFVVSTQVYDDILLRPKVAKLVAQASEIRVADVASTDCNERLEQLRLAIKMRFFQTS